MRRLMRRGLRQKDASDVVRGQIRHVDERFRDPSALGLHYQSLHELEGSDVLLQIDWNSSSENFRYQKCCLVAFPFPTPALGSDNPDAADCR